MHKDIFNKPQENKEGSNGRTSLGGGRVAREARELLNQVPPFRILSLKALNNRPSPDFLVVGLLKQGDLVMFYGPPKCGKTYAVIDLLVLLAKGSGSYASHFAVNRKIRSVYITCEGKGSLKHRFAAACTKHLLSEEERENIEVIEDMPNLWDPKSRRSADALIEALLPVKPDLIVLDTLAQSMVGGDENSQKDAATVVENLMLIREELGHPIIILIHHANKSDSMRGSTVFAGSCDVIVKFSAANAKGVRRMRSDGMKDAAEFGPVGFKIEQVGDDSLHHAVEWTHVEPDSGEEMPGTPAEVIKVLRVNCCDKSSALSHGDILRLLDRKVSGSTLTGALNRLVSNSKSGVKFIKQKNKQGKVVCHYYIEEDGLES